MVLSFGLEEFPAGDGFLLYFILCDTFFNDILIVSGYLASNYHNATIEGGSGYRFTDRRLGVRLDYRLISLTVPRVSYTSIFLLFFSRARTPNRSSPTSSQYVGDHWFCARSTLSPDAPLCL